MGEVGYVVNKKGDSLTVSLMRTEACAGCRACVVGMQRQEMLMTAKNECGANIGDYVNIELREGVFFKAILLMYALPLVLLIIGFFAGSAAGNFLELERISDIIGFFSGLLMMLLGYYFIKRNEKHFKNKGFLPMAVEIVEK